MARTPAAQPTTLDDITSRLERIEGKVDAVVALAPAPFDPNAPRPVLFDKDEHPRFLRWLRKERERSASTPNVAGS